MTDSEKRDLQIEIEREMEDAMPPETRRMMLMLVEMHNSPAWRYVCDAADTRMRGLAAQISQIDPSNVRAVAEFKARAFHEESVPGVIAQVISDVQTPYLNRAREEVVKRRAAQARQASVEANDF